MIIFNLQIFGDDALDFCSWTKEKQKEWIKKYTNQQSDSVIDDFLSNQLKNEEGKCMNCGTLNNTIVRHGEHISKTDADTTAIDNIGSMDTSTSDENSNRRSKSIKRKKA